MECDCENAPGVFYYGENGLVIEKTMKVIESGNWISLYQCRNCNQLWALDVWDKYSFQVANKVPDRREWDSASKEQRKSLLLTSRGGISAETCKMTGCDEFCVKGVAFCLDHLYETGARK